MKNSPQLWDKLLEEAPRCSTLMGGAIVDYQVRSYPKDYDIFHSVEGPLWQKPANWKFVEQRNQKERNDDYDIEGKDGNNPILQVENYDVELADNIVRVQLIMLAMDDPRKHFKNFDYSLTLAYYNTNGMFIHRKVFESIENKTVELINNRKPEKSMERAKRKVMKYDPEGAANWKYIGWE